MLGWIVNPYRLKTYKITKKVVNCKQTEPLKNNKSLLEFAVQQEWVCGRRVEGSDLGIFSVGNKNFGFFGAYFSWNNYLCGVIICKIFDMKGKGLNQVVYPIDHFQQMRTPFYCYDLDLLRDTIKDIKQLTDGYPYVVHYALKANANPRLLEEMVSRGLGADLVSGGELSAALAAGFAPGKMAFSGVGKADWEIRLGLEHEIGCFNVESVPELEIINEIAGEMGKKARVAIRVNPDIDAHTHRYVTTGTAENKFGISKEMLPDVVTLAHEMPNIHLSGLHFHIGSQITQMEPFVMLCDFINGLQSYFEMYDVHFETINVGGGLGIDYNHPDMHLMPDFEHYFDVFKKHLDLRSGQELHFELGRSLVAQCGSLITRVLYVKENRDKKFVILDAGMTDLIRPALYEAHHLIQNISSQSKERETYDVVGPVCESSDVFAHNCQLPTTRRGDFIALRSVGAYGESMASTYNMRPLPSSVFLKATLDHPELLELTN